MPEDVRVRKKKKQKKHKFFTYFSPTKEDDKKRWGEWRENKQEKVP